MTLASNRTPTGSDSDGGSPTAEPSFVSRAMTLSEKIGEDIHFTKYILGSIAVHLVAIILLVRFHDRLSLWILVTGGILVLVPLIGPIIVVGMVSIALKNDDETQKRLKELKDGGK